VRGISPLKSLEAVMGGYQEMPVADATKIGDGSVVIVLSADCELRNAD